MDHRSVLGNAVMVCALSGKDKEDSEEEKGSEG
jgi:hypothetical protein